MVLSDGDEPPLRAPTGAWAAVELVVSYNDRAYAAYRQRFDGTQTKAALLVTFSGSLLVFGGLGRGVLAAVASASGAFALLAGIWVLLPRSGLQLRPRKIAEHLAEAVRDGESLQRATVSPILLQDAKMIEELDRGLGGLGRTLKIGFFALAIAVVLNVGATWTGGDDMSDEPDSPAEAQPAPAPETPDFVGESLIASADPPVRPGWDVDSK